MKITPLGNNVLLRVGKVTKIGEILMPEQHQTDDEIAEIIAWGDKTERVWRRGDKVVCINGTGHPTGVIKDMALVREDNIIGVISKNGD